MSRFPLKRPGRSYLAGAPLLIAHRGGAKVGPENTLAAFRQAVDVWQADMLELDVRATSDGEIVVIHDATVDRTTDGTGQVADLPWGALQELDAGYRFAGFDGSDSFRGRGVTIPRFEDLLEELPGVRLNAEAKVREAARGLMEIIRRHGAEDRVLVAAELETARSGVRDYPGPWGASRRQITRFWALHRLPLGRLYTPRVDALQVPEEWSGLLVLTPRFVKEAHARNIPIHVWTVDDPDDMRRLLEWGVDGIQSDRPDLLAEVLVDVADRPPPPGLSPHGEKGGKTA